MRSRGRTHISPAAASSPGYGAAQAKEQAEYNKAMKAKEAMEAEGGDDMARAEQFLQLTTAKLTKARAAVAMRRNCLYMIHLGYAHDGKEDVLARDHTASTDLCWFLR